MDMMPIIQLIATVLGVFVIPGLVYYISTQIDRRLSALELNLEKRFGQIAQMSVEHTKESQMTHIDFERRIVMLESDRKSIHERFDQIQLNISEALRAPGDGRTRAHGQAHGAHGD